jgi:hypothetical protein
MASVSVSACERESAASVRCSGSVLMGKPGGAVEEMGMLK